MPKTAKKPAAPTNGQKQNARDIVALFGLLRRVARMAYRLSRLRKRDLPKGFVEDARETIELLLKFDLRSIAWMAEQGFALLDTTLTTEMAWALRRELLRDEAD